MPPLAIESQLCPMPTVSPAQRAALPGLVLLAHTLLMWACVNSCALLCQQGTTRTCSGQPGTSCPTQPGQLQGGMAAGNVTSSSFQS